MLPISNLSFKKIGNKWQAFENDKPLYDFPRLALTYRKSKQNPKEYEVIDVGSRETVAPSIFHAKTICKTQNPQADPENYGILDLTHCTEKLANELAQKETFGEETLSFYRTFERPELEFSADTPGQKNGKMQRFQISAKIDKDENTTITFSEREFVETIEEGEEPWKSIKIATLAPNNRSDAYYNAAEWLRGVSSSDLQTTYTIRPEEIFHALEQIDRQYHKAIGKERKFLYLNDRANRTVCAAILDSSGHKNPIVEILSIPEDSDSKVPLKQETFPYTKFTDHYGDSFKPEDEIAQQLRREGHIPDKNTEGIKWKLFDLRCDESIPMQVEAPNQEIAEIYYGASIGMGSPTLKIKEITSLDEIAPKDLNVESRREVAFLLRDYLKKETKPKKQKKEQDLVM